MEKNSTRAEERKKRKYYSGIDQCSCAPKTKREIKIISNGIIRKKATRTTEKINT